MDALCVCVHIIIMYEHDSPGVVGIYKLRVKQSSVWLLAAASTFNSLSIKRSGTPTFLKFSSLRIFCTHVERKWMGIRIPVHFSKGLDAGMNLSLVVLVVAYIILKILSTGSKPMILLYSLVMPCIIPYLVENVLVLNLKSFSHFPYCMNIP